MVLRCLVPALSSALQIYDLFTKVLDRLKQDKDAQGVRYIEEAVELWTSMMIEEHEHDDWCLQNIHSMQEECDAWLVELQSELDAKDSSEAPVVTVAKPAAARATRAAPPPAVAPASSPSKPSEKPVTMTMKLGMDFAKAGKEGSPERAEFEQQLVADLAAASGEDPSTFKITKLSPGSVVVETEISKSATGKGADPITVAKTLHKQAEDPNSPLRNGKLTSAVEDIAVPQEQLEEHIELVRLRAELDLLQQKLSKADADLADARKELATAQKQQQQQAAGGSQSKQEADAAVREAHELLGAMKKELEDSNKEKALSKKLADQVETRLSTQLDGAMLQVGKLTKENAALKSELAQKNSGGSSQIASTKIEVNRRVALACVVGESSSDVCAIQLQAMEREKKTIEAQFESARGDWAAEEKNLRKELAMAQENLEGMQAQMRGLEREAEGKGSVDKLLQADLETFKSENALLKNLNASLEETNNRYKLELDSAINAVKEARDLESGHADAKKKVQDAEAKLAREIDRSQRLEQELAAAVSASSAGDQQASKQVCVCMRACVRVRACVCVCVDLRVSGPNAFQAQVDEFAPFSLVEEAHVRRAAKTALSHPLGMHACANTNSHAHTRAHKYLSQLCPECQSQGPPLWGAH